MANGCIREARNPCLCFAQRSFGITFVLFLGAGNGLLTCLPLGFSGRDYMRDKICQEFNDNGKEDFRLTYVFWRQAQSRENVRGGLEPG